MVPNNANQYLPGTPQVPNALLITAITNTNPMVVTVATANLYIPLMNVVLTVPDDYKMVQANELTGQIVAINGLNFTLNIDASGFDPFVVPSGNVQKPASLAPGGSKNLIYDNFSRYVPFQSLTNEGN